MYGKMRGEGLNWLANIEVGAEIYIIGGGAWLIHFQQWNAYDMEEIENV